MIEILLKILVKINTTNKILNKNIEQHNLFDKTTLFLNITKNL